MAPPPGRRRAPTAMTAPVRNPMPRTSSKNPYQFSSGDARRVRQEHLSDRRVRARLRHGLPGHMASAPLTELPRPPRTVQSVPTGVSMPPSFSTTQPWHFTLSESPRPAGLPTNHDIVSTSVGVGLPAVEALREQPDAVGPILCCPLHQVLLIPVAAGTAHVWHAPHSRCRPGGRWDCAELADHGPGPCRSRFWIFDHSQASITKAGDLFDTLSLTRSRLRRPVSSACPGHRVREVARV